MVFQHILGLSWDTCITPNILESFSIPKKVTSSFVSKAAVF